MAERVNIVGNGGERIVDTSPCMRRIEPADFAAALGAVPIDEVAPGSRDLIEVAEVGSQLIKRSRVRANRPKKTKLR